MSDTTNAGEETPQQGSSEPVPMVIVDGVRYRPEELPSHRLQQGLIPDYDRPGWGAPLGRATEEQLTWRPVRGSSNGYPVSTGGSGRGGYPRIS